MSSSNTSNSLDGTDRPVEWSLCERGTLRGLGTRMRAAEKRRNRGKVAGWALAATTMATVIVAFWPTTPALGGISCETCVAAMPAYHDQLTKKDSNLTSNQIVAVRAHLADCPECGRYFRHQYPGVLEAAAAGFGLLAFAMVPRPHRHAGGRRG